MNIYQGREVCTYDELLNVLALHLVLDLRELLEVLLLVDHSRGLFLIRCNDS